MNSRTALGRGFAVAVVVVLALVGVYVLTQGGFAGPGLLSYLLAFSFALVGAAGIWDDRYRTALVGTLGLVALALLQSALLLGLAALLAVALVLAWNGRKREQVAQS